MKARLRSDGIHPQNSVVQEWNRLLPSYLQHLRDSGCHTMRRKDVQPMAALLNSDSVNFPMQSPSEEVISLPISAPLSFDYAHMRQGEITSDPIGDSIRELRHHHSSEESPVAKRRRYSEDACSEELNASYELPAQPHWNEPHSPLREEDYQMDNYLLEEENVYVGLSSAEDDAGRRRVTVHERLGKKSELPRDGLFGFGSLPQDGMIYARLAKRKRQNQGKERNQSSSKVEHNTNYYLVTATDSETNQLMRLRGIRVTGRRGLHFGYVDYKQQTVDIGKEGMPLPAARFLKYKKWSPSVSQPQLSNKPISQFEQQIGSYNAKVLELIVERRKLAEAQRKFLAQSENQYRQSAGSLLAPDSDDDPEEPADWKEPAQRKRPAEGKGPTQGEGSTEGKGPTEGRSLEAENATITILLSDNSSRAKSEPSVKTETKKGKMTTRSCSTEKSKHSKGVTKEKSVDKRKKQSRPVQSSSSTGSEKSSQSNAKEEKTSRSIKNSSEKKRSTGRSVDKKPPTKSKSSDPVEEGASVAKQSRSTTVAREKMNSPDVSDGEDFDPANWAVVDELSEEEEEKLLNSSAKVVIAQSVKSTPESSAKATASQSTEPVQASSAKSSMLYEGSPTAPSKSSARHFVKTTALSSAKPATSSSAKGSSEPSTKPAKVTCTNTTDEKNPTGKVAQEPTTRHSTRLRQPAAASSSITVTMTPPVDAEVRKYLNGETSSSTADTHNQQPEKMSKTQLEKAVSLQDTGLPIPVTQTMEEEKVTITGRVKTGVIYSPEGGSKGGVTTWPATPEKQPKAKTLNIADILGTIKSAY